MLHSIFTSNPATGEAAPHLAASEPCSWALNLAASCIFRSRNPSKSIEIHQICMDSHTFASSQEPTKALVLVGHLSQHLRNNNTPYISLSIASSSLEIRCAAWGSMALTTLRQPPNSLPLTASVHSL